MSIPPEIFAEGEGAAEILADTLDKLSALGIVFPEIGLIEIAAKASAAGLGFLKRRAAADAITIEEVRASYAEANAAYAKMMGLPENGAS